MLEVRGLETFYGRIQVLRGVSLEVRQGEVVSLIGANGAGKSTLLGTIAGLLAPRAGEVWLDGKNLAGRPAEEVVRAGISLVPERRQVFNDLTVRENLLLGAYHRFRRDRNQVEKDVREVLRLFPPLAGKEDHLAGGLSGGLQQMVAVGRGLMSRPRILMLDEPTLGLAPLIIRSIMEIILQLREAGTTILLVEQNARVALKVADRLYVLERGAITLSGTPEELLRDERIHAAYLGKGFHPGAAPAAGGLARAK